MARLSSVAFSGRSSSSSPRRSSRT
jgi:hypothetical protein